MAEQKVQVGRLVLISDSKQPNQFRFGQVTEVTKTLTKLWDFDQWREISIRDEVKGEVKYQLFSIILETLEDYHKYLKTIKEGDEVDVRIGQQWTNGTITKRNMPSETDIVDCSFLVKTSTTSTPAKQDNIVEIAWTSSAILPHKSIQPRDN